METLLFDSYRVFQKEYKGSIIRRFCRLPVMAIILFFIAIVSAVSAIILIFLGKQNISYICAGVEVVAGIATFIYTENYQNIQDILVRIKQQIERQENLRKTKVANIRFIAEVLLIPFLLAIFSTWITGNTDLAVLITGALALLSVFGTLGMLVYFADAILSFYQKHKLEQWRCFADDLQGVIDTQFEDKIIANLK